MINRREFLKRSAFGLALAGSGRLGASERDRPFTWSYLVHFGVNSWLDVPLETQEPTKTPESRLTRCMADHVRFDEDSWRRISAELAKSGCNQIVIDLAEIVRYPSHPELAVKGTWSVDRLRAELDRLRGMGFEVIPKMNFSTCHDTWLGEYQRMVSTSTYYRVCEDVIRDAIEIFDRPRLFHIGYDEETASFQRNHLLAVCRQGELWWHDLLKIVNAVEKQGCRAWMWSDYILAHKDEYLKRMPKSVLQSNWYYDATFEPGANGQLRDRIAAYEWLDAAGFDQVPTGSNFSCDTNFEGTVRFCDAHCSPERIKGYLMASWARPFKIYEEKALSAVRQLAAVTGKRKI